MAEQLSRRRKLAVLLVMHGNLALEGFTAKMGDLAAARDCSVQLAQQVSELRGCFVQLFVVRLLFVLLQELLQVAVLQLALLDGVLRRHLVAVFPAKNSVVNGLPAVYVALGSGQGHSVAISDVFGVLVGICGVVEPVSCPVWMRGDLAEPQPAVGV